MKSPIFVALDLDSAEEALSLAKKLTPYVGGFKVGPRLVYKYGSSFVQTLAECGEVFVDNKYYDIPSTMVAALKATFEAGASFATIHGGCGLETLKTISQLESELCKVRPFKVLCVTVLTSYNNINRPIHWSDQSIDKQVLGIASQVFEAGLTGIVCSAAELPVLKERHNKGFFVTPGIRFQDESAGDQERVLEPQEAMSLGANALVVGRPIYSVADPVASAQKYWNAVSKK